MKKYFLLVLIFFITIENWSQSKDLKYSFEYSNRTLEQVLIDFEELSSYKFYFLSDWIDKKVISGSFKGETLESILIVLLNDTNINFFITDDKKVILTKNSAIYDFLPDGFNSNKEKSLVLNDSIIANDDKKEVPVFFSYEEPKKSASIKTIRIGKANTQLKKDKYRFIGLVNSFKSKEPLADASVKVIGSTRGSITNKDGVFTLELPSGENMIEIQSLGYEKIIGRIYIYNDGEAIFDLLEDTTLLDEVLIEVGIDKNVKETITGLTRIDVNEIKTIPLVLGERDILKVATTMPGISKAGEGSTGYNVRGGKEDQNLILLDDAVIYNPTHFFGLFSALNPFTIGEVNIYKGNIPAEYGGRLSSVFDIKTKKSNKTNLTGEASIGPVTSNISLEIPIVKEKSSLLVGGRGAYSNWVLKSLDDKKISKSSASFYDFIVKYDHEINDSNDLSVTGYLSNDDFSISSDSLFSYKNKLVSLKWNSRINDKNTGNLHLKSSSYLFNILYDGEAVNDFKLGYNLNETELKLKMNYLLNKDLSFDYGISGKLYNINPGEIKPYGSASLISNFELSKEKALESAAFISAKFNVTDDLALNAGVRYVNYSFLGEISQRTYIDGEPKTIGTIKDTLHYGKNKKVKTYGGSEARVSARYFIAPSVSIKGSYNNMYQFIHTLSNNTTASPIDTWKLSDLNIKPQKSQQYSFGVFANFNDNLYEVSLEGYYKKMDNVLDYKVGADLLLNETLETEVLQGKGKSYGLELFLKKSKGKLNGWLAYTYSKSLLKLDSPFPEEEVNKGRYFPANFDKPHDFSLVSNFKFTKRFSGSMNFVYQTGRPVTYPIGSYYHNGQEIVAYSDRNKFRIPDYYRLDLSFNVEGNHKIKKLAHSFWNISVYNVLGRNNPYSVFFVNEDGEIKGKQSSIFSIPIPTITYNIKF